MSGDYPRPNVSGFALIERSLGISKNTQSRTDDETKLTLARTFWSEMQPYGYDITEGKRVLNKIGSEVIRLFASSVSDIGADNAMQLYDNLGVVNFQRYDSDVLAEAVNYLQNSETSTPHSLMVSGQTGDHNGAFNNLRSVSVPGVLPVEINEARDIDRIADTLKGSTFDRISICGHGDKTGLYLSDEVTLPPDTSELKKHPIGSMIDLVSAGDNGVREVNLVSCSAGKRFLGNRASLVKAMSEAFEDTIVAGSPHDVEPIPVDGRTGTFRLEASILGNMLDRVPIAIPGTNRLLDSLNERGLLRSDRICRAIGGRSVSISSNHMMLGALL